MYRNKIDRQDALKILNGGENFGLMRDGKLLVIEARQKPTEADTLFYYLSNVRQQNYQLRFTVQNMAELHLQPVLVDSYTNVFTPLSLTDSTFVTVSFNADPASRAFNRFKVIFRQMSLLPLNLTSFHAAVAGQGVLTNWQCANEEGVSQYEIQYSTDGFHFETAATMPVNLLNHGNYSLLLGQPAPGNNYYRLGSKNANGELSFSPIMTIITPNALPSISVAPNPIAGSLLRLHFNNEQPGDYFARLVNSSGQTIFSVRINFKGGTGVETISKTGVATGVYQLQIITPDRGKKIIKVIY